MKTRIARLIFAFFLFTHTHAAGVEGQQQQKPARRAPQGGGTVVFAVAKNESNVRMEPVVIYNRGTFIKPPIDSDAGGRSFTRDYFRAGRQYRLLSGGGDAGTLTVTKNLEPGCVGLVAEVGVETQARLGGRVQALATDSAALGRTSSSRRAPTDAERARAIELARAAYVKNSVAASLAAKMEVVNLTATDLDHDGRFELIGSFKVEKTDAASPDAFTLFIIYEPEGESLKAATVWFHRGYEGEFADRHFVDQLDIDGDGVAEVIAEGTYYESNDYFVYKRQQGRWRVVYQGGGGGC
ncbi:MAG: hypothetical protein QOE46_2375 [Acidobacteriota bacterium]|jgi:hypothetical protein|nr:hypothetical protein [Acidobacteriota bacterium]